MKIESAFQAVFFCLQSYIAGLYVYLFPVPKYREKLHLQQAERMIQMDKLLFTSESVTEGHPDKMCDQISDAILDALMEQDPMSRVACETATTTGLVLVMGEITTKAYVDIQKIVRDTVREIGYTRGKYGFDADTCGVITAIDEQSGQILPWGWIRLWRQRKIPCLKMRLKPSAQGIRE